jgi:hypothetical protein
MTPKQKEMQTRRLFLEEQIWTNQKYLGDLMRECKEHVVIKGKIMYSPAQDKVVNTMAGRENDTCCGASCAVCGQEFEWWCPKSPTHYCEYDETNAYGCKWCDKWKAELTAIAKRWIATEKKCRAHPLAYSSCIHPETERGKEYLRLSEEHQKAESELWMETDVEYNDKDPLRAACWEWRYWKVMARKCCHYQLTTGKTDWAGQTMHSLHMAEVNFMGLLGLLDEYKSPCQFLEEAFPGLKKGS